MNLDLSRSGSRLPNIFIHLLGFDSFVIPIASIRSGAIAKLHKKTIIFYSPDVQRGPFNETHTQVYGRGRKLDLEGRVRGICNLYYTLESIEAETNARRPPAIHHGSNDSRRGSFR